MGAGRVKTQMTSLEEITATFYHKRLISLIVKTLKNEGKKGKLCDRKMGNRCDLIFERKIGNDI